MNRFMPGKLRKLPAGKWRGRASFTSLLPILAMAGRKSPGQIQNRGSCRMLLGEDQPTVVGEIHRRPWPSLTRTDPPLIEHLEALR